MQTVRILWNPPNMTWDVVLGQGTARAVIYTHPDIETATQWAKDNGYIVHVHYVTT